MLSNPVIETILSRRSIRSYQDAPLTLEQKQTLVEAALISPSSMNQEEWHLTVVEDKAMLAEMEEEITTFFSANDPAFVKRMAERGGKVFYNAPALFSIATKPGDSQLVNVGIMAQSLMLAAKSMGLGSVCLGVPRALFMGNNAEQWKRRLHYPQGYEYGIMVAIGNPNMEGTPRKTNPAKATYIEQE